jgi:hypothetical protein
MTEAIASRTLSAGEYDALVEQVTTLVGQTGADGEQAIQALCGAIAFVFASHDADLAAIEAACRDDLPEIIMNYVRHIRESGPQLQ